MGSRATEQRTQYHSRALSRGLAVLRAMASADEPPTLADLHEITEIPKSTLVRLVAVLEEDGYVLRIDDRPAFRLGHALLPVARAYLNEAKVSEVVRPTLRELAVETGWTTNFGILEGESIVHLCVEYPHRSLRYTANEGDAPPAYCSGLGKVLLADLSNSELARSVPPPPFPAYTKNTLTTLSALRDELQKTRERGYAIDNEESADGVVCVAVPVRDGDHTLGALSISAPAGELPPKRIHGVIARLLVTSDELVSGGRLRSAFHLAADTPPG